MFHRSSDDPSACDILIAQIITPLKLGLLAEVHTGLGFTANEKCCEPSRARSRQRLLSVATVIKSLIKEPYDRSQIEFLVFIDLAQIQQQAR